MIKRALALIGAAVVALWVLGALGLGDFRLCFAAVGKCERPNVGGEARLAAHQPSHTTTATPQGVASTDQLGGRVRSEKD